MTYLPCFRRHKRSSSKSSVSVKPLSSSSANAGLLTYFLRRSTGYLYGGGGTEGDTAGGAQDGMGRVRQRPPTISQKLKKINCQHYLLQPSSVAATASTGLPTLAGPPSLDAGATTGATSILSLSASSSAFFNGGGSGGGMVAGGGGSVGRPASVVTGDLLLAQEGIPLLPVKK